MDSHSFMGIRVLVFQDEEVLVIGYATSVK